MQGLQYSLALAFLHKAIRRPLQPQIENVIAHSLQMFL
jgi:hypothetical protein